MLRSSSGQEQQSLGLVVIRSSNRQEQQWQHESLGVAVVAQVVTSSSGSTSCYEQQWQYEWYQQYEQQWQHELLRVVRVVVGVGGGEVGVGGRAAAGVVIVGVFKSNLTFPGASQSLLDVRQTTWVLIRFSWILQIFFDN